MALRKASQMALLNAVIVDPDGTVRKTQIENSLGAFQAVVGGYIEGVYSDDFTLYVNEEGLIQSLPFNALVTQFTGVPIFGTALILGPSDGDGNDTHVRPSVVGYYNLED